MLYLRGSGEEAQLGDLLSAANVHTRIVSGRPNAWRIQGVLPAQLDKDRVDVYHSLGFFLPLRWKGPKVVTVHDLNIYVHPGNWLRGPTVFRWMDLAVQTWVSVHAANRVLTDSESSRQQIERFFGRGRVTVIPLAADPFFGGEPSQSEITEARSITSGRPFILFVGILSPQKNLTALIRAFARSRLPRAGVRLVLAGSDRESYAATLRDLARSLNVADQLVITGFVSRPVLRAIYHTALGVVLPSHGEGFGLPLVEGMAAGTPILAANRQSIPEVLGDAGSLFDPDNLDEFSSLLDRLAEDGEFSKDLAQRSRRGSPRFSWTATADATAAVYEEVAAARRK